MRDTHVYTIRLPQRYCPDRRSEYSFSVSKYTEVTEDRWNTGADAVSEQASKPNPQGEGKKEASEYNRWKMKKNFETLQNPVKSK